MRCGVLVLDRKGSLLSTRGNNPEPEVHRGIILVARSGSPWLISAAKERQGDSMMTSYTQDQDKRLRRRTNMIRVEESAEIKRPVEEVFSYTCNPENLPKWVATVIEVRQDAPGEEEPLNREGER
jgi:uncharacterized membrane protein